MKQPLSAAAKRLVGSSRSIPMFRDGGLVRGPGTPTSDSVDAKLSRDEFVLPADTVRSVGIKSLRDLVAATHRPTGRPQRGHQFADGGMVDDQRKKANAFGDAAAAASTPGMVAVQPAPAPVSSPAAPTGTFTREELLNQIPKEDGPPVTPGRQVGDSWKDSDLGRNVYNTAMALPGISRTIPAVASSGQAISSGINAVSRLLGNASNVVASSAALPGAAAVLPSAAAAQTPSVSGRVSAPTDDLSAPSPASPPPSAPAAAAAAPATPSWDRTGMTNAGVGSANPQGRVTAQRQADGTMSFNGGDVSGPVSYRDGAGAALPGGGLNGRGFSGSAAAPAGSRISMDENGNYAFSTRSAAASATPAGNAPAGNSDARARLTGGGGDGFTGVIGQTSGVGNMWSRSPEQQRRDAEVQASSIHRRTAALGANALRSLDNQDLENVRGDNAVRRESVYQAGATARERLQQIGAMDRAILGARRFDDSNDIARSELALRQNAAGFQNRAAQRQEQAQIDLENAKTPEEQRSARQRLLALMGKTDDDRWKGIALQGGMDAQGNKTDSVLAAVNERTGEMRRMSTPNAQQQAAPPEGSRVRGKDGRTYVVTNGQPVPVGD